MARFRKIDVRVHRDEKYRALSAPAPSGRHLWLHLLTSPSTTNIPGLFSIGEAALSEEIGWSVKGFREAFAEVFGQGMAKADWTARLVWVPNAIRYNKPESPNVVRGWRIAWDELPECALKVEAFHQLKAFTEGLGEGFAKAFQEACAKPSPNQEQEQEQEQETTLRVVGAQVARPTRASAFPDDFTLTDARRDWAARGGIDAAYEFAKFRDHHRARGSVMKDWDAAWRTWCRNALEFSQRRATR